MSEAWFRVECPECGFYKDSEEFDERMSAAQVREELAGEAEAHPEYCSVSHFDIGVERVAGSEE